MKKPRKKANSYNHQKLQSRQHRNEFISKLKYLVNAVSGFNTTDKLIPETVYREIYENRARSIRIVPGKTNVMDPKSFLEFKNILLFLFKEVKINFTEAGPKISIDQYFTVGQSLKHFINHLSDDHFPFAALLKDRLSTLLEKNAQKSDEDVKDDLSENIRNIINLLILFSSDFRRIVIWTEKQVVKDPSSSVEILQLEVNSYKPVCLSIEKDEKKRNAYEVCWGDSDIGLVKPGIMPSVLQLPEGDDSSLPVFVQNHALNRLVERLDNVDEHYLFKFLVDSVLLFNFKKSDTGTSLIEYVLWGKKVGYLIAEIVNGIVLVETFLFITNSGTPEGEVLGRMTKLNKLDKQYLSIDKLSTFYNSDISENETVKQLFIDAGCNQLFEVDRILITKPEGQTISIANTILNYLGMIPSKINKCV